MVIFPLISPIFLFLQSESFNIEQYTEEIDNDIGNMTENIRNFENSKGNLNLTFSFKFRGDIIIQIYNKNNETTLLQLNFYLNETTPPIYRKMHINSSYQILIEVFSVQNYSLLKNNNSKFLLFNSDSIICRCTLAAPDPEGTGKCCLSRLLH